MKSLFQNIWRFISSPYAFFEEAINRMNPIPSMSVFVVCLLLINLGWWQVVPKVYNWRVSLLLPLAIYPIAVLVIYVSCHLLVRENRLSSFFAVWGFSYVPTFLFFGLNIISHWVRGFDLFPNALQQLLIIGLWTVIFLLFLWKFLLLTITLRLAGNLNLKQMIITIFILSGFVVLFWWAGLGLGWFKVPFI